MSTLISNSNILKTLINRDQTLKQVFGLNWSQVRYRKHVSFRKYLQPHLRQKILLAICEPVFPKPQLPTSEKCTHLLPLPEKLDHPYDILLAKDMKDEINNSKLICLFHQNQMKKELRKLMSNEFEHENMFLRYYNKDIVRICCKGTRYEPLINFSVGYWYTILFAPDLTKIDKIFRISKKYPQVTLMAALVDGQRFVTIKQLEEIANLGDLDHQRALLCNTLNIGAQSLFSTLNHHTSQLNQLLTTHQNQSNDE